MSRIDATTSTATTLVVDDSAAKELKYMVDSRCIHLNLSGSLLAYPSLYFHYFVSLCAGFKGCEV